MKKTIDCIKTIFISLILVIVASMIILIYICNTYLWSYANNPMVAFLLKNATIQTSLSDSIWSSKYPYDDTQLERYEKRIEDYKKVISTYCTSALPGQGYSKKIKRLVREIVCRYRQDEINQIYMDYSYIRPYANSVIEFNNKMAELNRPFLYVQTPLPETINYYYNGKSDDIAQKSVAFSTLLKKNGIDMINLLDNRDLVTNYSFDKSNHWFPRDGKTAAEIISKELNAKYGFDIDLSVYNSERFINLADEYPVEFEEVHNNCDYQYELLIPKEDYDYSVIYAESEEWSGDFKSAFISDRDKWDLEKYAYHNMYRISNSLIYEIHNDNVKADRSILIIGDSYNWPVATYLSLGIKRITVIHNASFSGSIISYINKHNPDMVLIIYNDAEFNEIFSKDAFYLD